MSSICKIIFIESTEYSNDNLKDTEGLYSILIPEKISVQINRSFSKFNEIEKIISDFSFSFSFTASNRDVAILNHINYTIVDDIKQYKVFLLDKGINVIEGLLCVSSQEDSIKNKETSFSFQIIGSHQKWKELAKKTKLNDLDFGTYTATYDNNIALWQSANMYTGTNGNVYPFLANHGQWLGDVNDTNISIYDGVITSEIMFLLWLKPVWEKFFCMAGYTIQSRFLNSVEYKKQAVYAMKQDLDDSNCLFDVNAYDDSFFNPFNLATPSLIELDFSTELDSNFNNGNCFNELSDKFEPSPGLYSFTLNIYGTISNVGNTPNPEPAQIFINYRIIKECNGSSITIGSGTETINGGGSFGVTLNTETYLLTYDCRVYVEITRGIINGTSFQSEMYVNFLNEGTQLPYAEGDTINVSEYLNEDLHIYDLLVDESRLYGLRFKTDEVNKILYVEPEVEQYRENETGQSRRGFYLQRALAEDITSKINFNKKISKSFPNKSSKIKSYQYQFKTSNDYLVDKYNSENEIPLYGSRLVVNSEAIDIKIVSLSVYEATVNKFDDFIPKYIGSPGPNIPHFWSSEPEKDRFYPEFSYNVGVRRFNVFGYVTQLRHDNDVTCEWWYNGNRQLLIPTVGQEICNKIDYGTGGILSQSSVVFEGLCIDKSSSLMYRFIRTPLLKFLYAAKVTLGLCLTSLDFICINERKYITLNSASNRLEKYNGIYKITDLKRVAGKDDSASITLNSIPSVEEICKKIDATDNPCKDNRPLLIVNQDGSCFNFSIGGSTYANIDTISWEHSEDSSSWEQQEETETHQLCRENITGCVQVRAVISYEEIDGITCPPTTLNYRKICKCISIVPKIICNSYLDEDNNVILIITIDTEGEPYEANLFYQLGAEPLVEFGEGQLLVNLNSHPVITGTLDFDNDDCGPKSLGPITCELVEPELLCPTDMPTLRNAICDDNNCWTINRSDVFDYSAFMGDVRIEYQCWDRATDTWDNTWWIYQAGNKPCCDGIRTRIGWFSRSKCCKDLINEILECKAPSAGDDTDITIG